MFVVIRAVTYATLFIGLVLIYVPAQLLPDSGLLRPTVLGGPQIAGMIIGGGGAVIALWCIFTFAFLGKGTPAPFDPPCRLVIRGPYRFVRNPMYIGAGLALLGAALFYRSRSIAIHAGMFLFVMHLFVIAYEKPTLRRTFAADYESYCRRVSRWWPSWGRQQPIMTNEDN
jgi:protein-S-isoprenylcysteine O-methyltransferase Ste14